MSMYVSLGFALGLVIFSECQEKQTLEEQSRAANEVLFKKKKADHNTREAVCSDGPMDFWTGL